MHQRIAEKAGSTWSATIVTTSKQRENIRRAWMRASQGEPQLVNDLTDASYQIDSIEKRVTKNSKWKAPNDATKIKLIGQQTATTCGALTRVTCQFSQRG